MGHKISGKLTAADANYSYPALDVNVSALKDTVTFLTTTQAARNYRNLESLDLAADYIFQKFNEYGLATERQCFEVDNTSYWNIIGSSGEETQERVIIGAHYDVCEDQPGADDNASAVAGLLEIARLVNNSGLQSAYRFDFAAYSLEEPPFFMSKQMGSYVHAKSLHEQASAVRGMICLEMIGYFSSTDNSQDYPFEVMKKTYPSVGNFIAVVGNLSSSSLVDEFVLAFRETSLPVESLKAPSFVPGVAFSDHQNYWKFGYPAVMVTDTAFYRNPNYHQVSDTMDTLNFDKMAEVVKGVTWALLNMTKTRT